MWFNDYSEQLLRLREALKQDAYTCASIPEYGKPVELVPSFIWEVQHATKSICLGNTRPDFLIR